MYNSYKEKGVVIVPNVVAEGDYARLIYNGILSNSGAEQVYAHVGSGDNWENVTDVEMSKTPEGFEAEFYVTSNKALNIAFKDCANNWDNNTGHNYTFKVEAK